MVSPENSGSEGSPNSDENEIPKETLNYCEGESWLSNYSAKHANFLYLADGLPIYWLAQALLNILYANNCQSSGTNVFSGLHYGDMLKSARTFTRTGEGVPIKIKNLSASQARDGSHCNSHPENPLSNQFTSERKQNKPPTPAPTSSNPPSVGSTNFNPSEVELSALSAGMNEGTFAGILQALTANSGGFGMNIGLNVDDYPTQSGSGSGLGSGAAGAGSTAVTPPKANADASHISSSSEGNGNMELTENDLAAHLGFLI